MGAIGLITHCHTGCLWLNGLEGNGSGSRRTIYTSKVLVRKYGNSQTVCEGGDSVLLGNTIYVFQKWQPEQIIERERKKRSPLSLRVGHSTRQGRVTGIRGTSYPTYTPGGMAVTHKWLGLWQSKGKNACSGRASGRKEGWSWCTYSTLNLVPRCPLRDGCVQHVEEGPCLILLCDVVPFTIPFAPLLYPYGELLETVWWVFLGVTVSRKFQALVS